MAGLTYQLGPSHRATIGAGACVLLLSLSACDSSLAPALDGSVALDAASETLSDSRPRGCVNVLSGYAFCIEAINCNDEWRECDAAWGYYHALKKQCDDPKQPEPTMCPRAGPAGCCDCLTLKQTCATR